MYVMYVMYGVCTSLWSGMWHGSRLHRFVCVHRTARLVVIVFRLPPVVYRMRHVRVDMYVVRLRLNAPTRN